MRKLDLECAGDSNSSSRPRRTARFVASMTTASIDSRPRFRERVLESALEGQIATRTASRQPEAFANAVRSCPNSVHFRARDGAPALRRELASDVPPA